MKKLFIVAFMAVLAVSLFFFGFAGQGHSAPIKLLFASFSTDQGFASHGIKAFAQDLEAKTGGRVKAEFSWASALGTIPEYYDLVTRGVCDVSFFAPFMTAGVFPLCEIVTLPYKFPTADIATKAFYELYKKGLLDKRLDEEVKTLFVLADAGSNLRTIKKPATTLNDIKGLKLMTPGAQIHARATAMGAVPVLISGGEVYMALQKGTVDGQITGWTPLPQFKWCEVTHFATEPLIGGAGWAVVMNKKTYGRLPKDIQSIIDDMSKDNKYGLIAAKGLDELMIAGRNCFQKKGGKIVEWTPAAYKEIEKRYAPLWEKWVSANEAKGVPARQSVNEFYRILEKLGVKNPAVGYKIK